MTTGVVITVMAMSKVKYSRARSKFEEELRMVRKREIVSCREPLQVRHLGESSEYLPKREKSRHKACRHRVSVPME